MLLQVLAVLAHSAFRRFKPSSSSGACLCHHKEATGCLARYSKDRLEKESNQQISLDADYLEDIDSIFNIVRKFVKNLVILQPKMILSRPWCAGEITTATNNIIHIVPVGLNDYIDPDEATLAQLDEIELGRTKPEYP